MNSNINNKNNNNNGNGTNSDSLTSYDDEQIQHSKIFDQIKILSDNLYKITDDQIKDLLTLNGEMQQELFKCARETRSKHIGNEIKLRGVIEISNFCQKSCDYCAMRSKNTAMKRFRLDKERIISIAKAITETGIDTVFLQAGQDPKCDATLEDVIPAINNLGAEVLLNVGERNIETYKRYVKLGAKSFILKYETSDHKGYEHIAHEPLHKRLQCMRWIREAGMKIGTGNIVGLPLQSIHNLVSDIKLAFDFRPDFVSCAPFIPNEGTPLYHLPFGDINLTLNTMAILRIALKNPLIPSVSALEYIRPGGQVMGLNAGANVLTINFTPKSFRENYNIYTKNRFIVTLNHAINTANLAGLYINKRMNRKVIT